jgi:hypothetical protein
MILAIGLNPHVVQEVVDVGSAFEILAVGAV